MRGDSYPPASHFFINMKQLLTGFIVMSSLLSATAAELWIGRGSASITPEQPVSLAGQFYRRVATKVAAPCTANVIRLESREGGEIVEQATIISVDIVSLTAAA